MMAKMAKFKQSSKPHAVMYLHSQMADNFPNEINGYNDNDKVLPNAVVCTGK